VVWEGRSREAPPYPDWPARPRSRTIVWAREFIGTVRYGRRLTKHEPCVCQGYRGRRRSA
jgi:hypothetical protein